MSGITNLSTNFFYYQGVKKARHNCVIKMPSTEEIDRIHAILKKSNKNLLPFYVNFTLLLMYLDVMDPLQKEEKELLWHWKVSRLQKNIILFL